MMQGFFRSNIDTVFLTKELLLIDCKDFATLSHSRQLEFELNNQDELS